MSGQNRLRLLMGANALVYLAPLLAGMARLQLTLVLGQYALAYHLPGHAGSLTTAVQDWRSHWPRAMPLPHPSPRNNGWLKHNPWFEVELLPVLRTRVAEILSVG